MFAPRPHSPRAWRALLAPLLVGCLAGCATQRPPPPRAPPQTPTATTRAPAKAKRDPSALTGAEADALVRYLRAERGNFPIDDADAAASGRALDKLSARHAPASGADADATIRAFQAVRSDVLTLIAQREATDLAPTVWSIFSDVTPEDPPGHGPLSVREERHLLDLLMKRTPPSGAETLERRVLLARVVHALRLSEARAPSGAITLAESQRALLQLVRRHHPTDYGPALARLGLDDCAVAVMSTRDALEAVYVAQVAAFDVQQRYASAPDVLGRLPQDAPYIVDVERADASGFVARATGKPGTPLAGYAWRVDEKNAHTGLAIEALCPLPQVKMSLPRIEFGASDERAIAAFLRADREGPGLFPPGRITRGGEAFGRLLRTHRGPEGADTQTAMAQRKNLHNAVRAMLQRQDPDGVDAAMAQLEAIAPVVELRGSGPLTDDEQDRIAALMTRDLIAQVTLTKTETIELSFLLDRAAASDAFSDARNKADEADRDAILVRILQARAPEAAERLRTRQNEAVCRRSQQPARRYALAVIQAQRAHRNTHGTVSATITPLDVPVARPEGYLVDVVLTPGGYQLKVQGEAGTPAAGDDWRVDATGQFEALTDRCVP